VHMSLWINGSPGNRTGFTPNDRGRTGQFSTP
jgi:hypothetical protein